MVKTVAVFLAFMAMFACALWVVMNVSAAMAYTSMPTIQQHITNAVQGKFPHIRVLVHLQGCRRIDEHGGQCVVRLYTMPYREKYCGVGWSRIRGGKRRIWAAVTPCPTPRGMPQGTRLPGGHHPIEA